MANKKTKKTKAVASPQPVFKPLGYLRRKPVIMELIDHGKGKLTDQSGKHEVGLEWNLNEMAQKDKVFKLTVDGVAVYLDLEELTFYTRAMFIH